MDKRPKHTGWRARLEAEREDPFKPIKRRATQHERDALGDAAQRGAPDEEVLALAADVRAVGERWEAVKREALEATGFEPWPEGARVAARRLFVTRFAVASMREGDAEWGVRPLGTRAPAKLELGAVVLALAAQSPDDLEFDDAIEAVTAGAVSEVWELVHPGGVERLEVSPRDDGDRTHYRHVWRLPSGERADSKSSLSDVKDQLVSCMARMANAYSDS